MPPAQGPSTSSYARKKQETNRFLKDQIKKQRRRESKSNKIKRKPIPLDPVALTFLTTNCRNRYEVEKHSGSNTLLDVEFFYGILESVKPVVFFALDTPVSGNFNITTFSKGEIYV